MDPDPMDEPFCWSLLKEGRKDEANCQSFCLDPTKTPGQAYLAPARHNCIVRLYSNNSQNHHHQCTTTPHNNALDATHATTYLLLWGKKPVGRSHWRDWEPSPPYLA